MVLYTALTPTQTAKVVYSELTIHTSYLPYQNQLWVTISEYFMDKLLSNMENSRQ